jgi:GH35 family endo-1,4-beta-xylanase
MQKSSMEIALRKPAGRALILGCALITASAGKSLRDLADAKGILFGAAAGTPFFTADTLLKANLKREFNGLVAEYQMKFGQLQPTRGAYNWTAPDKMLAFADSNGMELRGHCLAWHKEAGWLESGEFSREEMFAILKDHIHTVVGRYKGRKERGVPIDGVGLQCHFRYDSLPAFEDMDANLKRLAGLGLSAAFTEVDFRIPVPATPEALEKQAEDYRKTLEVCLANPNCRTFVIRGVSDA